MREVEIMALAGINEANHKAITSLLDGYKRMIFPGEEAKDPGMDQAKAMLAKEVQNVYIINPHGAGAEQVLNAALTSKNPEMRKWAQHEKHKENMAKNALHERYKGANRSVPLGVTKEKR